MTNDFELKKSTTQQKRELLKLMMPLKS